MKCADIPCVVMYLCAFTIENPIVNDVQHGLQEFPENTILKNFTSILLGREFFDFKNFGSSEK